MPHIIFVMLISVSVALLSSCTDTPRWAPENRVHPKEQEVQYIVDTDPSDTKDPDDRLAAFFLQRAGNNPQLVSATNGNVPLKSAFTNARELWPNHLVVPGAKNCTDDLVQRYQQELTRQELTILALGSMRNIALVLACHPELAQRIRKVIIVAGRTPNEEFWLNPDQKVVRPMRDLNFETDRQAMRRVLEKSIPVTFVPFAAGNMVRILPLDLQGIPAVERIRVRDHASTLAIVGGGWTIPPFDLVAAAYLLQPASFNCRRVQAEVGKDLVLRQSDKATDQLCLPSDPKYLQALLLTVLNG